MSTQKNYSLGKNYFCLNSEKKQLPKQVICHINWLEAVTSPKRMMLCSLLFCEEHYMKKKLYIFCYTFLFTVIVILRSLLFDLVFLLQGLCFGLVGFDKPLKQNNFLVHESTVMKMWWLLLPHSATNRHTRRSCNEFLDAAD